MKVTFLAAEVGMPTSGQSRFVINLARGAHARGHDVTIVGLSVEPDTERSLASEGVRTIRLRDRADPLWRQGFYLTPYSKVGRRVAEVALRSAPADRYVVLSDAAVDAIERLDPARSIYISNGDLTMMLLSPTFFATNATSKWLVSRSMGSVIRQNARRATRYAKLIGNSEFTRRFMSFLYGVPFTGVIHPPVDVEQFRPAERRPSQRYALAVARNGNEQGLRILSELAGSIPIHLAGGAEVPGTQRLGRISEERLRAEYAGAELLLFPVVSEFFGYAVAEALASGTPVVAFDSGGPGELIDPGRTGWLARDATSFIAQARAAFSSGVPPTMRVAARASSSRFSVAAMAAELDRQLEGLDGVGTERGSGSSAAIDRKGL